MVRDLYAVRFYAELIKNNRSILCRQFQNISLPNIYFIQVYFQNGVLPTKRLFDDDSALKKNENRRGVRKTGNGHLT